MRHVLRYLKSIEIHIFFLPLAAKWPPIDTLHNECVLSALQLRSEEQTRPKDISGLQGAASMKVTVPLW